MYKTDATKLYEQDDPQVLNKTVSRPVVPKPQLTPQEMPMQMNAAMGFGLGGGNIPGQESPMDKPQTIDQKGPLATPQGIQLSERDLLEMLEKA